MEHLSDEEWEARGFKKVYIPMLGTIAWMCEADKMKVDYSQYDDIEFLEYCLALNEKNEQYEECTIIKKRIEELKK